MGAGGREVGREGERTGAGGALIVQGKRRGPAFFFLLTDSEVREVGGFGQGVFYLFKAKNEVVVYCGSCGRMRCVRRLQRST